MRINFLKYFIILILLFILLILYLSTVGIETEKFNNQIKTKVYQINKNLDLKLNKVRFTLDPLNFKIKVKTIGATVFYLKRPLLLETIKTEISLNSFIKKKLISSKVKIVSRSILLNDLVKFIRAKNNSLELLILQKTIKNGFIILDLDINFDEDGKIYKDFIINGTLKDGKIELIQSNIFKNINFDFNIKKEKFSFSKIKFSFNNINFLSEKLSVEKKDNFFLVEGLIENKESILKKEILNLLNVNLTDINLDGTKFVSKSNFSLEIDKKFTVKNTSFDSDFHLDKLTYNFPNEINNYVDGLNEKIELKNHKLKINYKNKKINIIGNGAVNFYNKFEKIAYSINKFEKDLNFSGDMMIEKINLKTQKFLYSYFPELKKNINLQKHKIKFNYKDNNFNLIGKGKIKIDKKFEKIEYIFSKNKKNLIFDINLNLNKTKFKIDKLNYQKKDNSKFQLRFQGRLSEKKFKIVDLLLSENKNKIEIKNLIFGNNNHIINLEKANFNYTDIEEKKNEFSINKINKDIYKLEGSSLNANSLITNLIENDSEKNSKVFNNDISIKIDLDKVYIDEIYFIKKLDGKIFIKNNKVVVANLTANFKDNDNINLVINTDEDATTITTLTSTWAKPLINRYKFIKGFEEGYLDFHMSKKDGISNSVLVIDNFKVKEISVLAKLLALASLQGIADLLTGEGIRFTDFEMKFSNNKKLMNIEELYAIGPSISILMEGYIQSKEIISLRGTLVPASTINRTIASIPFIGDLLVGKKVGEGVFGVSFKIKGPPKDLETTVNPIKTLTPRFITRTLEKIKKN